MAARTKTAFVCNQCGAEYTKWQGQCEACGRAHRHVVKNPRDAMALESFGRHLASCLAGKQAKSA